MEFKVKRKAPYSGIHQSSAKQNNSLWIQNPRINCFFSMKIAMGIALIVTILCVPGLQFTNAKPIHSDQPADLTGDPKHENAASLDRSIAPQVADNRTCTLAMHCTPPFPGYKGPCPDAKNTSNPEIIWYEP